MEHILRASISGDLHQIKQITGSIPSHMIPQSRWQQIGLIAAKHNHVKIVEWLGDRISDKDAVKKALAHHTK
jgi:hypothetical protein